jgi:DNA polymerase III alpha subunit
VIQLRVRTEYSFGDTFAPMDKVVACLKEQGCTHAGIVDKQSTWGHVRWFKACKAVGIQPLLGVELVVTDEEDSFPCMWFLAKNLEGLQELYRWASKTYQQPMPGKRGSTPALRRSDVRKMSDNIVKFAGDFVDEEFLTEVGAVIDISPASRVLALQKRGIAERNGLRLVGVSDNAYCKPEDKETFQFIGSNEKPTPQHILVELENQDCAIEIANSCSSIALPRAPMIRAEGDLEALCREGIKFRKMEGKWTEEYEARLKYELELIESKDFVSYFLIVADMVCYAKQHMLVGPSRGSSAGSLVCWLTRITEVDPIQPKLFFERFIDVSRSDLPDIDLDFPDNKRHMVFDYMAAKYGAENTAHIGTLSVYRPKSALIRVCKALNIPPAATGAVKVAMIERSSADSRANNCLEDTLTQTDPGKLLVAGYPAVMKAAALEGHASHTGVHAAGLLVSNEPVTNYATIDEKGIAHIDKGSAEDLGLLKIDVLGLRTLGILEDSGLDIDWYGLPFDDSATYDVFNQQRLCGIFQFEGNALRAISHEIDFKSIIEIDAVTALARPGPFGGGVTEKYVKRKKGEPYKSIHPLVESYMSETYGLPVYQEQTLAIVKNIGKFDWKETSTIRKAMSKRMGKEFFDKYWEKFKEGAASQGIEEKEAKATWEMINAMGAWQMNKAHTYSYAVISYWTAYLKAHHPMEFAAANLRNAKDEDSAIELLREMVKEGINYVPFDIEKSEMNWCAKDGILYGGFMNLHGFGESKAKKAIEQRASGKLDQKMLDAVNSAANIFSDIFPFQTLYGDMYANPVAHNIAGKLWKIDELKEGIPHKEQRVVLGELIYKNASDINAEVNVKKRGGKVEDGPREFIDVRLRDDTGTIGGRISRWDYQAIGKDLLENVPVGAHLMVRATFFNGIRYLFIQKWKRIDK